MYYKVMKGGKVIDVLDHLVYVMYQPKHQIMLRCEEEQAQGILSSDGEHIWHIPQLYLLPTAGYDTVELEEIDVYEYERLRMLCLKTAEEIIDAYTLSLLEGGIL